MTAPTSHPFALPDHLAAKASPAHVAADVEHFAAMGRAIEHHLAVLTERLDAQRRAPAGSGQAALERDQEVHRLSSRLRTLRRFGLDLCLGRMVRPGGSIEYVGRLGLTDVDGHRLLTDWRAPAAEPFFAATHAHPLGLVTRRRYRWEGGLVRDYWDEAFSPEALADTATLDDQSSFVASLGASRSARMRDVLATIAADQDAIVRADARGALVVDGGPGTGKTVVALHRAAYLLYADPLLEAERGGVLVVGPHEPYLAYVADVLPNLGEEGVRMATLRDLVPEGARAGIEADDGVARLKSSLRLVDAVDAAVRFYERPPTEGLLVETPWAEVWLSTEDWAEAFDAPEPGTPHNEARDDVWAVLLTILTDKHETDADVSAAQVRGALQHHRELSESLNRAWPLVEASDLVADLWSVPAYLRRCAPSLTAEEVRALQRDDADAWTVSDLPLLDAARDRLGDPDGSRRRRQSEAWLAAERARMNDVVEHLLANDDSEMLVMSMLRGEDLRTALDDESAQTPARTDPLAGPFAHIIVDEAQELSDAQWQMLRRRCPSGSFTVVGDRAQARAGFPEPWADRLERVGLPAVRVATLGINYRTPSEVMAEAEPVIREALPDANVPTSVRSTGIGVTHAAPSDLDTILETWLDAHDEGTACVIGDPVFVERPRVRSLSPELAKGLEFDLVVLVHPERFGPDVAGAVDRYVAMTRATQRLVVLAG